MSNPIEPDHYKLLDPEPIKVIEAWNLGFCDGNAIKYIARASRKGRQIEDLKKASWYINRLIQQLEGVVT